MEKSAQKRIEKIIVNHANELIIESVRKDIRESAQMKLDSVNGKIAVRDGREIPSFKKQGRRGQGSSIAVKFTVDNGISVRIMKTGTKVKDDIIAQINAKSKQWTKRALTSVTYDDLRETIHRNKKLRKYDLPQSEIDDVLDRFGYKSLFVK